MARFQFVSSVTLEPWSFETPWTTGIGGSETSHVEMAHRLALRGHSVTSYAPVSQASFWTAKSPSGLISVPWRHYSEADFSAPGVWVIYRDPSILDNFTLEHPGQKLWFVAQDVDYSWTDDQLSRVDRYLALCQEHAKFTGKKYASLRGRIYVTSNGVRRDVIEQVEREGIKRNPRKMVYASSPDRGLALLLEIFPRIREYVPDAELVVCYGFNNADEMARRFGRPDLVALKDKVMALCTQPGVTWRGRIDQLTLYREWFSAGLFVYPSDWPETSCISIMDAQACGAIPITTKFWAQGENAFHGVMLDPGLPQKDPLAKVEFAYWTKELMLRPERWEETRREMMVDARDTFDWNRMVEQWSTWTND